MMMNRRGQRISTSLPFWMVLALGSVCVCGWNIAGSSGIRYVFLLLLPPCAGRLLMQSNIFNRVSAAYFWLCDKIGDLKLFETARELFLPRSRQSDSTIQISPKRRFWYRMYRHGYTLYRLVMLALIAFGLLLVLRGVNAGNTPIWVF